MPARRAAHGQPERDRSGHRPRRTPQGPSGALAAVIRQPHPRHSGQEQEARRDEPEAEVGGGAGEHLTGAGVAGRFTPCDGGCRADAEHDRARDLVEVARPERPIGDPVHAVGQRGQAQHQCARVVGIELRRQLDRRTVLAGDPGRGEPGVEGLGEVDDDALGRLVEHRALSGLAGLEVRVRCRGVGRADDGDPDGSHRDQRPDEAESRAHAERVEFERQLGRAQQFEAFGQLSIGVAHDFNNVVTALLGGVEELVDELGGRQSQRLALELFGQLQRARSLMDELARYAREPAAGVERCDLGEVIEELRPMLLRLTRMEAHLELNLHAGSVIVSLGRSQVDQIVVNLVLNALEALRPGGHIRVETRDSQRPASGVGPDEVVTRGGITLTVTDDGAGIDPSALPHVFEAGFSTKGEPRNLGMGLMSVRRIVEAAGGTIEIDSDLGVGTAVRMWLPIVPAGSTIEGRAGAAPPDPPGGSELLLLAEDDIPVRNRVAGILRAAGYGMVAVDDGPAALAAARQRTPDALVTDVSMPQMSGLMLCEELCRHQPELPVLLMSGFAFQRESEELASPAGLLQKPFTRAELLEAVRRMLDEPARSAVGDR